MAVRIMIAMPLVMAIVFSNGEVCTETSTNLDDAWTMCPITHEVQSEKHHTDHLGDEDPDEAQVIIGAAAGAAVEGSRRRRALPIQVMPAACTNFETKSDTLISKGSLDCGSKCLECPDDMSRVLKRRRSKETDLKINAGYCKLKNSGEKLANGEYPFPASCRELDHPTVLGEITEENTIRNQYISTKPALLRYPGQPQDQLIFALKRIVCEIPDDKDLSKRNCKVFKSFECYKCKDVKARRRRSKFSTKPLAVGRSKKEDAWFALSHAYDYYHSRNAHIYVEDKEQFVKECINPAKTQPCFKEDEIPNGLRCNHCSSLAYVVNVYQKYMRFRPLNGMQIHMRARVPQLKEALIRNYVRSTKKIGAVGAHD